MFLLAPYPVYQLFFNCSDGICGWNCWKCSVKLSMCLLDTCPSGLGNSAWGGGLVNAALEESIVLDQAICELYMESASFFCQFSTIDNGILLDCCVKMALRVTIL